MQDFAGLLAVFPRFLSFGGGGKTIGSSISYTSLHVFRHLSITSPVINPLILLNPASSDNPRTSLTIDY